MPKGQRFVGEITWTDEKIQLLCKLLKEGKSMGVIGESLGKTRNSIAGKIGRLRLKENPSIEPKQEPPSKPKVRIRAKKKPDPPKILYVKEPMTKEPLKERRVRLKLVESDTAVTLYELTDCMCKWPIGSPKQSDFRYCGKLRPIKEKPYCAEHTQIAVRPSNFVFRRR